MSEPIDLSKVRRAKLQEHCPHRPALVDSQARRVECAACGAALDAFDVLDHVVRDVEWMRRLVSERCALEKDVGALRDELRKLKASKRRLMPEELREAKREIAELRAMIAKMGARRA